MSYADYDRNTVNLALDLGSLGEGTLSIDELRERQQGMLDEHGYRGSAAEERQMAELGRRLATVLGEAGDDDFLDSLAALLEEQPGKPFLSRHDGTPHLHYTRDDAPFGDWVSTMAVAGLVTYVCREGRSRLRRCVAAGCGHWFADTSRNSSRRYCEHACASRTTVAAFRARQRDER